MPKQGQSVESCIIIEWKKQVGDTVAEGDNLCDVETDKATLEVPAPTSGTLLAQLYAAGDDVPVLETIAVIGAPGEDISSLVGGAEGATVRQSVGASVESEAVISKQLSVSSAQLSEKVLSPTTDHRPPTTDAPISPRARHLAERKGFDASGVVGTGPEGRIIERDVLAALASQPKLTPVARAMVADGGFTAPAQGTGAGGRVTSRDLQPTGETVVGGQGSVAGASDTVSTSYVSRLTAEPTTETTVIPMKGVRKVIAERMLASLQTTAQLTMTAFADARALQAYRKRLKESPESLGLRGVTINDLVLLAVSRVLVRHADLNALLAENAITQYAHVHLGMAVDTPRGLVVPVIRNADLLSLKQIAAESKRLSAAAIEGKSAPDDLNGGTFTVSNLGAFGVESFTPVLNPPQVGILGVGGINLRPVEAGGNVEFIPHIALSLTINHQAVDGAPGARFLQTLSGLIASIDLVLAG